MRNNVWILFALLGLLLSCGKGGETPVPQTVTTRTVAVVAPQGARNQGLKHASEWFQTNFKEAQKGRSEAIDLQLEWHNESSENLRQLAGELSAREDIIAIVGPFDNDAVAIFADVCKNTHKPLIAPCATSEEVIRRFAVTTSGKEKNLEPFLWSLTSSDVSFTETLLSAYAAYSKFYDNFIAPADAAFFSPDNNFGQTFYYWAPFFAAEDEMVLLKNEQYASTDELVSKVSAFQRKLWEENRLTYIPSFCVVEDASQMVQIAREKRRWMLQDPLLASVFDFPSANPDDPANDREWQGFSDWYRTYFAFNHLNEEMLESLGERGKALLEGYGGFSPYADPGTGFELSWKERFGSAPTLAQCKFYDALLLCGLAAFHAGEGGDLNGAIVSLVSSENDPNIQAWSLMGMQRYLEALERGVVYDLKGACGDLDFDPDTYTAATGGAYVYWQVLGGQIVHRAYFGGTGAHSGEATAAWRVIFDQKAAAKAFEAQAGGEVSVDYPPLTGQYAVLVQGSHGYSNYRHLSDVLSVYQLLRHNGWNDDHIILIIDKSTPSDAKNPEKGVIRASVGGADLYGGTGTLPAAVVDYDNAALTPSDIAAILQGKASGTLPTVLPQDAGQNVFFYWSGHGDSVDYGSGEADAFVWRSNSPPRGFTAELLRQCAENMSFRKLLVVCEPCYGEGVIRPLEGLRGVLALSGASAAEQSWADNWSSDAAAWLCDRFTRNVTECLWENPRISWEELYLYCASHTLGSHARIVNSTHFGNLYVSSPAEFIVKQ